MKSPAEFSSAFVSPKVGRRRRRRWLSLLGLGAAAVAALTFTSLRPEPTPPLIDVARVGSEAPAAPAVPEAAIPEAETVAEAETLASTAGTTAEVTEGAASTGQVMRLPPVYINVSLGNRKGAEPAAATSPTSGEEPPSSATETGHE